MTSERVGSLTILTACMYAFTQYLQHGIWIFPFGLYKLALFIAIILMFVADKQRPTLTGWLAFGWSFSLLLSSKFFLQLFISEQKMRYFMSQSLFVDFSMILFCLLFFVWAVMVSLGTKKIGARILGVFFAVAITGYFVLNLYTWAALPLIGWLFCIFQEKDRTPTHFNIITLFAFLYLTAWVSGVYSSSEVVLRNM